MGSEQLVTRQAGGTSPIQRLPTGIEGLDAILQGGLIRGGMYLVTGWPGTGKTVLGNHIAFNHAAGGGRAVFSTVLAETHDRMAGHLIGLGFFDPARLARDILFVNLFDELNRGGLAELPDRIRRVVREHGAQLLVIDGAAILGEFAESDLVARRFIYELQAHLTANGCTSLLLADYGSNSLPPLASHVDGIIALEDAVAGQRDVRMLRVLKHRGSSYLSGRHTFCITPAGFEVDPRLEAAIGQHQPVAQDGAPKRLLIGIEGLDDMLRGGLPAGSSSLLHGAPGAGKTLSLLHFLVAGAERGEPGLLAGFHEAPDSLIAKATSVGLDLARHVREGRIRFLWHPPYEVLPDAWGRDLVGALRAHRPLRFCLDSLSDIEALLVFDPGRAGAFVAALVNELRSLGTTSLHALETRVLIDRSQDLSLPTLVAAMDNIIWLRYVELRSQLHRLISVVKMRESDYDTSIREFAITQRGLEVAATFESAEAVIGDASQSRVSAPRPTGETV